MGPKQFAFATVIAISALLVTFLFVRLREPLSTTPNGLKRESTTEVVSASELVLAYADPVKARERFAGKKIIVRGKIMAISGEFDSKPSLVIHDKNGGAVIAVLAEQSALAAMGLTGEESITVSCTKISELARTPLLRECRLL